MVRADGRGPVHRWRPAAGSTGAARSLRRLVLWCSVGLLVVIGPSFVAPAWGGEAGNQSGPCPVSDTEPRVDADAPGTAATGECLPPRRWRLIDSAVWVLTLAAFVAVVVALFRSPSSDDGGPPGEAAGSARPGPASDPG